MASKRKKINVNIKFLGDKVVCAKSPGECRNCKDKNRCENMDLYYYIYKDIKECMQSRSYKRNRRGAIVEKT